MKWISVLALISILFTGCATTAPSTNTTTEATPTPAPTATPVAEKTPEATPTPEPPKPVKKTITTKIAILVRENNLFSDGVLDEYTLIEYAEDGTSPLKQESFDADSKERVESMTYEYDDAGFLIKKTTFDKDNQVRSVHVYTRSDAAAMIGEKVLTLQQVNAAANMAADMKHTLRVLENPLTIKKLEETTYVDTKTDGTGWINTDHFYADKEQLMSVSRYEYNEFGAKIVWQNYNESDVLQSIAEYVYDDMGNNVKIDIKRATGEADGHIIMEYDDAGNMVTEEFFNPKGELERMNTYEYTDGKLMVINNHRANKSIKTKNKYEYNENGIPARIIVTDSKDKVKEIIEQEYVITEIEKEIWVHPIQ